MLYTGATAVSQNPGLKIIVLWRVTCPNARRTWKKYSWTCIGILNKIDSRLKESHDPSRGVKFKFIFNRNLSLRTIIVI